VGSGTGVAVVVTTTGAGVVVWGAVPVHPARATSTATIQTSLNAKNGFMESRMIYKGKIILE
jgi:hypothetical protein